MTALWHTGLARRNPFRQKILAKHRENVLSPRYHLCSRERPAEREGPDGRMHARVRAGVRASKRACMHADPLTHRTPLDIHNEYKESLSFYRTAAVRGRWGGTMPCC